MSLESNSSLLLFATKYPIDKVVAVFEGSESVSAGTTVAGYLKRFTIPHSFTRPLFTKMLWSTNNSTWVDGGFSYRSGDANRYPSVSYSDSSNVYILTGLTSGTIYYKIITFWIDDYDATNPDVADYSPPKENFLFDSRLNYQKIKAQGEATFTTASETINVSHGMGYYPNHSVFFEAFSGQVWPALAGGASNYFLYDFVNQGELEVRAGTTNLSMIWTGPATSRRAWYRIYLDE